MWRFNTKSAAKTGHGILGQVSHADSDLYLAKAATKRLTHIQCFTFQALNMGSSQLTLQQFLRTMNRRIVEADANARN